MGNCCSIKDRDNDQYTYTKRGHTDTVSNHRQRNASNERFSNHRQRNASNERFSNQQQNLENCRPQINTNQQPRFIAIQNRIDGNNVNEKRVVAASTQRQNDFHRQPLTVNVQQLKVESNQQKNRYNVDNQKNNGVCYGNGAVPKERLKKTDLRREKSIINQNINSSLQLNRPAVNVNQIPLTFKILEGLLNFKSNIPTNYIKYCKQNLLEIKKIKNLFMKSTQNHFNIINVQQVLNPYSTAAFMLRKKEYQIRHLNCYVEERLLFHGTKKCHVNLIAKNNFDWRLHGKSKGNIFGKGVCFSPISNYSSNYCDENVTQRSMFVSSVLVCLECKGNINMNFPPSVDDMKRIFYDTSVNPKKTVIVKYRDDDFCPKYIINFEGYSIRKDSSHCMYIPNEWSL